MKVNLDAPRGKSLADACKKIVLVAQNQSDEQILKSLADIIEKGALGPAVRLFGMILREEIALIGPPKGPVVPEEGQACNDCGKPWPKNQIGCKTCDDFFLRDNPETNSVSISFRVGIDFRVDGPSEGYQSFHMSDQSMMDLAAGIYGFAQQAKSRYATKPAAE